MKNVLLIAYYFDPFKGVGSKRMSYWANAFFNDPGFTCTVVTAIPQPKPVPGVIFVQDKGDAFFDRFFQGFSWARALKAYFRSNQALQYDYVIISGGPFGHFGIGHFFKQKYKCKVILDFRDPFSRNTRFKTFVLKELIKIFFEKSFLKAADHVITVNDYCKQLLLSNISEEKISIIENGYDERAFDSVESKKFENDAIHIVYAGMFYADRDPTRFIKALIDHSQYNKPWCFHHIGSPSDFLVPFRGRANVIEHGEQPYSETIKIMKACHLGLLVTSGEPMESTTKIYDYIGCNLDVLVVTSGEPRTGSIQKILATISSKAHWVKNEEQDIHHLLKNYKAGSNSIPNRNEFSRRHGFEILKDLLTRIR